MKIAAFVLLLVVPAGQVLGLTVCDVQEYNPLTGYSPYNGSTVTITGLVTAPAGIFVPTQTSMYIRGLGDDVCGINIFAFGQVVSLALGDTLTVTGTVEEYLSSGGSGATTELVFTSDGLTNIRRAAVHYVEPVEMQTGQVGKEENEGKLVQVRGKVVGIAPPEEVTLDDGSGPIPIHDFGGVFESDSTWQSLRWGDEVVISGIVNQYDPSIPYLSNYEIWPRGAGPPFNDISVPECIPDTVISRAVIQVLDGADRETAIFCPDCPGSDGRVKIKYNGPNQWRLELRVFDCQGREAATLHDYYSLCGARVYEWDGRDEVLQKLPIGLYHLVVTATDPFSGKRSQATLPIVIGRRLR